MQNYTAKDIEKFQNDYCKHITHVAVAHTKIRPFNKTQFAIDILTWQAKRDCRHAINCFEKLLYPNATNRPVRKPELYKLLTFVTIENAKQHLGREQTIHFNFAFGNFPVGFQTNQIELLFRHAWVNKANQADDVKFYNVEGKADEAKLWHGYSLKEAQQVKHKAWRVEGIWDVENCWIPHAALNAD